PARARARSRFGRDRASVRRAQRRSEGVPAHGHRRLPLAEEVHRHLRPGPERPSRSRALAARGRHRVDLAQSRHGGRNLARPRQQGLSLAEDATPSFAPIETHLGKGAAFAVLAAFAFSFTGVCVKLVSTTVSNEMVVFVRNFVSFLVLAPWLLRGGWSRVRTTRLGGHFLRA